MPMTVHRRRASWLLVGTLLSFVAGCGTADSRLVELSERSLARQAEQNQEMSKQSQQVAQATKDLVAADALARKEVVTSQAQ
jgi:hypothetical protein